MNKLDFIEEKANMQERLILKVRNDLRKVRDYKTEHHRQTRINEIIHYLNSYKMKGG